jgi:hypothetical protein
MECWCGRKHRGKVLKSPGPLTNMLSTTTSTEKQSVEENICTQKEVKRVDTLGY